MMPVYDCGDPDCDECKREFGPDRSEAIKKYKLREAYYAKLDRENRLSKAQADLTGDGGHD